MKIVYLSLGSNLGDREAHLRGAIQRLVAKEIEVRKLSSLYETEPRDRTDQPWFLNLVAEVETKAFPLQLLDRLQAIEREMGRKRIAAKGPRNIDLDILLYGSAVIQTPKLSIPHPRMAERRFVLEPLAEIAPDARHPVLRRSVRDLLRAVEPQRVRLLAPPFAV